MSNAGFHGFFDNPVRFVVVDERLNECELHGALFHGSRHGFHRDPGVFAFKGNRSLRRIPLAVKNEDRVACDDPQYAAGVVPSGFGEVSTFSLLIGSGLRRIKTGDGGHDGTRVGCNGGNLAQKEEKANSQTKKVNSVYWDTVNSVYWDTANSMYWDTANSMYWDTANPVY